MEKKIRLFRHHHSSYHYCYQDVFLHDNKQLFLLPSVAPLAAGVQHGFLFPSGKVQRKANLKSWGGEESWERQGFFALAQRKRFFQKILFCLERLVVIVERAFQWKRAKQP